MFEARDAYYMLIINYLVLLTLVMVSSGSLKYNFMTVFLLFAVIWCTDIKYVGH